MNDTKLKIIRAAKKLTAENGFTNLRLNDVSILSGVSTGTLYRTVGSKDELLIWMLIDTIHASSLSFDKIIQSTLSPKEKVICITCFPFFYGSIYDARIGAGFWSSNKGLFKKINPELISELQFAFTSLVSKRENMLHEFNRDGFFSCSKQQINTVMKKMILLSRGSAVVADSFFIPSNYFDANDIISFCDEIVSQLHWKPEFDTVSTHDIIVTFRTISDANVKLTI